MNKVAIGAAILGLTSVVAADMMSRLAQTGALPTIIFAPSDQSLKRLAATADTGAQPRHRQQRGGDDPEFDAGVALRRARPGRFDDAQHRHRRDDGDAVRDASAALRSISGAICLVGRQLIRARNPPNPPSA